MSNQKIKKRDTVKILPTGKFGIIMDIQYERKRYQLYGVSNWQLGIENIEKQNTESLLTLIAEQAKEIEKLKLIHEDYRKTALARIDYEVREKDTALSSLNLATKALELIANGNNDFPTPEDTVDVLKDVRLVAKDAISEIQRRGKA